MEAFTSLDWFAVGCWLSAFVLIALGFAGTVVPAIPGLPMIAGGAWLIGCAGDYEKVGWKTILFLAVLAAIGVAIDTVFYGEFSAQKLAGGALAFAGLVLNATASRKRKSVLKA